MQWACKLCNISAKVWRPCSDFTDMLWHLISCHIIIIINLPYLVFTPCIVYVSQCSLQHLQCCCCATLCKYSMCYVTLMSHVKVAEHIIKCISRLSSPIILVFSQYLSWQVLVGYNTGVVLKICDNFLPVCGNISCFKREICVCLNAGNVVYWCSVSVDMHGRSKVKSLLHQHEVSTNSRQVVLMMLKMLMMKMVLLVMVQVLHLILFQGLISGLLLTAIDSILTLKFSCLSLCVFFMTSQLLRVEHHSDGQELNVVTAYFAYLVISCIMAS